MPNLVAVEEGRASLVVVGGTALLGLWSLYHGVQTWRGQEVRSVVRAERDDPDAAARWMFGGRRRYQTFLGGGLSGIPAGLGMLLLAAGLAVRDALDKPLDWGPWYAVAVIGTVLLGIAVVYQFAYFWTGVPDRLRPPSQRSASASGSDHRRG